MTISEWFTTVFAWFSYIGSFIVLPIGYAWTNTNLLFTDAGNLGAEIEKQFGEIWLAITQAFWFVPIKIASIFWYTFYDLVYWSWMSFEWTVADFGWKLFYGINVYIISAIQSVLE